MSDPALPPPLPPGQPPEPSPPSSSGKTIVLSFGIEAGLWLTAWLALSSSSLAGLGVVFLLLAGAVMPFVALVLLLPRSTRPQALGILLAAGIGWLVLGAICGAFR